MPSQQFQRIMTYDIKLSKASKHDYIYRGVPSQSILIHTDSRSRDGMDFSGSEVHAVSLCARDDQVTFRLDLTLFDSFSV